MIAHIHSLSISIPFGVGAAGPSPRDVLGGPTPLTATATELRAAKARQFRHRGGTEDRHGRINLVVNRYRGQAGSLESTVGRLSNCELTVNTGRQHY